MSRVAVQLVLMTAAVVAAGPLQVAGADPGDPRVGDALEDVIRRIDLESSQEGAPWWAGVYSNGDGFSTRTLAVAPRAGFAFRWRGCIGAIELHGSVRPGSDGLDLVADDLRRADYPKHVDIVRWGEQIYLIPDGERVAFCNAVNAGDEPGPSPYGMFLRRRGGGGTTGAPTIPRDWGPCLLAGAVEVEVVSWLDEKIVAQPYSDVVMTTVVVSAGRDAGFYEGLELFTGHDDVPEGVVVDVADTSARLQFEQPVDSWTEHPDQRPAVGWVLTSRRPPPPPVMDDDLQEPEEGAGGDLDEAGVPPEEPVGS